MNELYHHGIKGMHWGVRRYQNPDGTLTNAGKRRMQSDDRAVRKNVASQRNWNAKNASQLSDKELTDQILRLQREKQLQDLTSQVVRPGRKKTLDMIDRYGNQVLATAVGATASAVATAYITNKINPHKSEYDKRIDQLNMESDLIDRGYYTVNDNGKLRRTSKTDKIDSNKTKK